MAPAMSRLENAFSYCEKLVREHDPDHYWAGLFAAADKRPYLFSLYAFSLEIARVREQVSSPLPGEIRFQWWRDLLDGINAPHKEAAEAESIAHPVAEALIATIQKFHLPLQAFHDLIDARVFDLYDDAMPSLTDLEGYCGETSSVLFRLASIILCDGKEPGGADAAGHAGVAYAMAGLLRALPWQIKRGQVFLPFDILKENGLDREGFLNPHNDKQLRAVIAHMRAIALAHFDNAREGIRSVSSEARAAFLPLALVPAYLAQTKKRSYQPRHSLIDLPQWRKLWILWRTAQRWGRG